MELKFDTSKVYAIALEGGGARGAWQVGAWRALEEARVRYNAVSGTSVGALNGALMAMRDLPQAERLWKDIRFSQVMNVDDDTMNRIMNLDFENLTQVKSAVRTIRDIIHDRGLDVEPLRNLLAERVDEEKIRNSDVDFFLSTVNVTDRKEMEIDAKNLEPGELQGMLLASAYHPAFKQEKISGKTYFDGGFYDVVPISALVTRGYKDLIVLRIYGFGVERRVKIPEDVSITTLSPSGDLGNVLNFNNEKSAVNMAMGYFDTQRMLYGLAGTTYCIDRTYTEEQAYKKLIELLRCPDTSLRELNEQILPKLAEKLHCKGDYYELYLTVMERLAVSCSLTPFRIRTDEQFFEEVMALRNDDTPDKPDKILDLFLTE
ncbi:MAG: patatin-like phospholipase family protein [Oscillospiraceae bacterium]|nr:patatin-like phospholipase family protein [Oscillospiraceae bacterium]